MSYQINAVKAAIYTALTSDSTLTAMLAGATSVYDSRAPQGADLPYVIFQKMTGTPAHTFTGRAWDDSIYLVKAITEGDSSATAGAIAEEISAALEDVDLTISGASTMYLRRISDVDYPEMDNGKTYHHVGGQYRLWTA